MPKSSSSADGPPRTLGPVSDLERHLPSDWWRTLFNSVYLKTDGDVVENDDNTRADVDALLSLVNIPKDAPILDVCCGQGRHCLELARRGYTKVNGLDRSRYLVRLARRRARHAGVTISFREGDARRVRRPSELYACVTLFGNSFGYFEQQTDDAKVLETIKGVLQGSGTIFLDLVDGTWMRNNYEPRSWEWIDQQHLVCRERSLHDEGTRLVCREVVVHSERGIIADQFYAERLYSEDWISDLLKTAGFQNVKIHGKVASDSTRNQDLGMMAHRILVTAQAPRITQQMPAKPAVVFKNVAVLMGDPGQPDEVKRVGEFSAEDFDTINRLKSALGELTDFSFTYWDKHEEWLSRIPAERPEFVFNLCDEGYNNDAFKELHVPALLEMLNIPYTGAGPSCLGLCYNKAFVKSIAEDLDIPVPAETYYDYRDQSANLPSIFPALLKPVCGDSSFGITKDAVVQTPEQLLGYLDWLKTELPGRSVLVQEFLSGNEYSVGVVGNPGLTVKVLPILEVDFSALPDDLPPILGYESKWLPDSPYWTAISYKEADLNLETQRNLGDWSLTLFERLGCRDYARFDFRADANGVVKLLEVNPNPGWCWDGKLNLMAEFAGMTYTELLDAIIRAGQERVAAEKADRA